VISEFKVIEINHLGMHLIILNIVEEYLNYGFPPETVVNEMGALRKANKHK
jgi:hypothetical protein